MTNKLFLIVLSLVTSMSATAQVLTPTQLLQMDRLWQINDPHSDRNTYEYLTSIDKNWRPDGKPIIDETGYTSTIYYTKDYKSWFRPQTNSLLLTVERGTLKRALVYSFEDVVTWENFLRQMGVMNAVKVGTGPQQGGTLTIYNVNDIVFMFTDYPPGINGDGRTFTVIVTRGR